VHVTLCDVGPRYGLQNESETFVAAAARTASPRSMRARATGNVATEDVVYLLEGEGIDTGVAKA
jgi:hypothetical protein